MEKLTRFGVSMDSALLDQFDRFISQKGYTSRSEAFRDIVREKLAADRVDSPQAFAYGALAFVYDHHKREIESQLTGLQHDAEDRIISTTHVHIDHGHCMEVIMLKGRTAELTSMAERLLSLKGVQLGKLFLTPAPKEHVHD